MSQKFGILLGRGNLPRLLVDFCQHHGRPYFLLAFAGQAEEDFVKKHPHAWIKFGEIGKGLKILNQEQVTDIVMVGALKRPSLKTLKMDLKTMEWVAKIGQKAFGDDGLLGGIVSLLEQEGFKVVGAHEIMNTLLMRSGALGRHKPDEEDLKDIHRGIKVAYALGEEDIGQAVVVEQGVILAVEAFEGTDALLRRSAELKFGKRGGVLVKRSKPQQEKRVDLPTIGLETVQIASKVGLKGIALESAAGLILNQQETIALADKEGLFIYGFTQKD
jgi:hypothetical protein